MCPSLVASAEGEAALDSGAVFSLVDPVEFGDFYKDLEASNGETTFAFGDHLGGSTFHWACERLRVALEPASTVVAAMTSH